MNTLRLVILPYNCKLLALCGLVVAIIIRVITQAQLVAWHTPTAHNLTKLISYISLLILIVSKEKVETIEKNNMRLKSLRTAIFVLLIMGFFNIFRVNFVTFSGLKLLINFMFTYSLHFYTELFGIYWQARKHKSHAPTH